MEIANELRINRGARTIQNVTAHVVRRTYITLAFEALHPLPYVMAQVGHSDSRVTTEVYAQVCARRDRAMHMAAFDRLLAGEGLIVGTLVADAAARAPVQSAAA